MYGVEIRGDETRACEVLLDRCKMTSRLCVRRYNLEKIRRWGNPKVTLSGETNPNGRQK